MIARNVECTPGVIYIKDTKFSFENEFEVFVFFSLGPTQELLCTYYQSPGTEANVQVLLL